MEGTTYQQQITANLDELREQLWSLCCLGHSDLVLNASREVLATARAMQAMVGRESGHLVPGDRLVAQEPRLHNQRRRSQQGRRR